MIGRRAVGFQIEPVGGGLCLDLPTLIECNDIMNNRDEIPTPEVALAHAHLKHLAPHIPKLDPDAKMAILLGRDIVRVHKVRQQVNGPYDALFAQRLDLGWVIVGEVCLDSAHKSTVNLELTSSTTDVHLSSPLAITASTRKRNYAMAGSIGMAFPHALLNTPQPGKNLGKGFLNAQRETTSVQCPSRMRHF